MGRMYHCDQIEQLLKFLDYNFSHKNVINFKKSVVATFWATFDKIELLLIPSSGHTGLPA